MKKFSIFKKYPPNLSKLGPLLHGHLVALAESVQTITVARSPIKLRSAIKCLGVYLDSHMSFVEHVSEICKASYFRIRALHHIHSSLTTEAAKMIAVAIVGPRLDYCNSFLGILLVMLGN